MITKITFALLAALSGTACIIVEALRLKMKCRKRKNLKKIRKNIIEKSGTNEAAIESIKTANLRFEDKMETFERRYLKISEILFVTALCLAITGLLIK